MYVILYNVNSHLIFSLHSFRALSQLAQTFLMSIKLVTFHYHANTTDLYYY